jgi:nucleoside-diphosphate-sugar epimerase
MTERRNVLVTGATGFIGRHVLPRLIARGYRVHAVGRTPIAGPLDVQWHNADLLAPGVAAALAATIRPSHLLHLAWTATSGEFWIAPENVDWVAASLALYRSFAIADGRRALFVGTCAEYDWSHALLDEGATPCNPATLYGAAKDALHRVLRVASVQDGVSLAWGRLFSVYGPFEAERRLVPSVALPLLRGAPAPCGSGIVERDFMHVEDVAEALATILDSRYEGPVNVASGVCPPLRDIIDIIAKQVGGPPLVRFGTRPSRPHEPHRLAAATAVLRSHIGFVPQYTLEDGLTQTIAWWRARLVPAIAEKQVVGRANPRGIG